MQITKFSNHLLLLYKNLIFAFCPTEHYDVNSRKLLLGEMIAFRKRHYHLSIPPGIYLPILISISVTVG